MFLLLLATFILREKSVFSKKENDGNKLKPLGESVHDHFKLGG